MLASKSSNKKQKLMEVTMNDSVSLNDNDYDPRLSCALGQEDVLMCSTRRILQYNRSCKFYWQK